MRAGGGIPPALPYRSEREADAGDQGSRLQEVGAAEGRQEVIQRDLVGKVGYLERPGKLFVLLGVEQVVAAEAQVEYVAGLHAVGIVVIVLLAGLWQGDQLRRHSPIARGDGIAIGGEHIAAGKTDGSLLCGREGQSGSGIRHTAHDLATIEAPCEGYPFVSLALVADEPGGLECLVVIDAEPAAGQCRSLGNQPAHFGWKIPGSRMTERPVRLKAV